MPFKSQTWNELKLLLQELSPRRLRFLAVVLLASLFQGIIDILLVGLLAAADAAASASAVLPKLHGAFFRCFRAAASYAAAASSFV